MERDELEQWLCGPDAVLMSPLAMADALGLPAGALADTTLLRTEVSVRSLRFTLAVLHDAFPSDLDAWRWLETSRPELGGATPRAALVGGRCHDVEALATRTWNSALSMAGAA